MANGFNHSWAMPSVPGEASSPPVIDALALTADDDGLDTLLTVTDVVCEDAPEEVLTDPSIRTRSRSKRDLILQAQALGHIRGHYTHIQRPLYRLRFAMSTLGLE